MSTSTYHGNKAFESAGKTVARAWAYAPLAQKRASFFSQRHIVIASRECGDIAYLLALGVRKSHILACDIDPHAVKAARKLGVPCFAGDIASATRTYINLHGARAIGSVNVDLCVTLCAGVPILRDTVYTTGLALHTPVFYTFTRNRDRWHSTEERIAHLSAEMMQDVGADDYFTYQSSTRDSIGTPMCVAKL